MYTCFMEIDKGLRYVNFLTEMLPTVQTSSWAVQSSDAALQLRILDVAWYYDVAFSRMDHYIDQVLPKIRAVLSEEYKQTIFEVPTLDDVENATDPEPSDKYESIYKRLERIVEKENRKA